MDNTLIFLGIIVILLSTFLASRGWKKILNYASWFGTAETKKKIRIEAKIFRYSTFFFLFIAAIFIINVFYPYIEELVTDNRLPLIITFLPIIIGIFLELIKKIDFLKNFEYEEHSWFRIGKIFLFFLYLVLVVSVLDLIIKNGGSIENIFNKLLK